MKLNLKAKKLKVLSTKTGLQSKLTPLVQGGATNQDAAGTPIDSNGNILTCTLPD
ncbi:hypothetical protein PRUB_b1161 [Pseudoalteromonas rubra]|uniref:Uncharacterized protein n=1 Tax=Pseudoalteromonas rubra TaxID=43658 RepID=A0A8T0C1D8_9GAMM|nr:hypothetical protein [Pseudoalteromonas rubra]KAF7781822.1 hypothetical protein PRUB_b1161 [Pseudoalteromonas rubra]